MQMIDHLKTIREALEAAESGILSTLSCGDWASDDPLRIALREVRKPRAALDALEQAMREPVAFIHWPVSGGPRLVWHNQKAAEATVLKSYEKNLPDVLLFAAPPAQQAQRPDFHDEWAGYLKDGETPFERFLRERKDLGSLTKLYQRALEENERLKAQQPQAEAVPDGLVSRPDEKADYGHDNSTPVLQTPYYCAVCNEHMGDVRSPDDVPLRKWAVCYSCQKRATPAPQQAEAVPPNVTDAMVDAYLQANDAYWRETDTQPKSPTKWRNGNPKEATRVSLAAALAAAPQPKEQSNAACRTDGRCQYAIDHDAEKLGHCPTGKCVMPRQAETAQQPKENP